MMNIIRKQRQQRAVAIAVAIGAAGLVSAACGDNLPYVEPALDAAEAPYNGPVSGGVTTTTPVQLVDAAPSNLDGGPPCCVTQFSFAAQPDTVSAAVVGDIIPGGRLDLSLVGTSYNASACVPKDLVLRYRYEFVIQPSTEPPVTITLIDPNEMTVLDFDETVWNLKPISCE